MGVRIRTWGTLCVLVCAALTWPRPAAAQENGNFTLDRHVPGIDRYSVIGLESGKVLPYRDADARLWLGFGHNFILLRNAQGDRLGALVGPRLGLRMGAAYGLLKWLEISADAPLVLYQDRASLPPAEAAALGGVKAGGLGNVLVGARASVLEAQKQLVDLAISLGVGLPTAAPRSAYLGEKVPSIGVNAAVSRALGPITVVGNLGYQWRTRVNNLGYRSENVFGWGVGAEWNLKSALEVPLEVAATIESATSASKPFTSTNRSPMEMMYQGTWTVNQRWQVFGGGAFGLIAGVGAPDFRLFAGLRFTHRQPDTDKDGVPDIIDECKNKPEDMDGVADSDGCPEKDADEDGIPDNKDQCPEEAENYDGIEDEDGCPEEATAKLLIDRIEINDSVHFESGRSIIKRRSYKMLKSVAKILVEHPEVRIEIAGHTDSQGPAEDNLYLSQDRADAVRRFLIKQGVGKDQLSAKGYGEDRPIATNKTPRGRARNRRVEFNVTEIIDVSTLSTDEDEGSDDDDDDEEEEADE